jgi:hypothetical protein
LVSIFYIPKPKLEFLVIIGGYMRDTYYSLSKLSFNRKLELLNKAYECSYNCWVDKLDGSCCRRQRVDMSFEEVMMSHFNAESVVSMIYRNNYKENYLEVGFRSMGKDKDWFLWIQVDEKHKDDIVDSFKKDMW